MQTAASPVISLRAADESDVPAITRIYADAVLTMPATFELDPPSEGEMLERMRDVRARDFPYFVALARAQVVGYAYAAPYRLRPAYRYTVEDSVYVASDMHGRGAGAALLRELIDACTRSGYRQLVAVIGGNAPASIALHRAQGFDEVGRLRSVGRKFDRWLDTTLMQRALGAGDADAP